jgi:superfamily II DNA or RNA helicase
MSGRRLEKLPFVQQFPPSAFGELTTRLLPELRLHTALTVRTDRLPGVDTETPPRIALEVDERDGRLSVMATLVYGDPPQARIDDGRLVHLQGPVPVRDTAMEQRLLRDLRDRLDLLPGRRRVVDGQDAAELASKLRAFRGQVRGGELLDAPELAVDLAVDGDRFELSFAAAGKRAETRQVLAAWRHNLELVPLLGGGFARLPADWLARHGARAAALLDARDTTGALPAHAAPELARLCDELDRPRPDFAARIAPLVDDFTGLPTAELPADLACELRPYQRTGVDWLGFLAGAGLGGVLADDMGLGKTVQTLAALPGRTLVVCPRSVVHNWADEIAAFRPALSVATYHGAGRAIDPAADVTLTTYGTLRQDADALAQVAWDAVVLDEAQAIKNPESQTAAAARALPGRFRLALTGTPIENRLDELWSLLDFCNPGLLGGRGDFKRELGDPAASGDDAALARLRERIGPFVLRRLKRDVLPDLPPRTDSVLHVELDAGERAVYDAVRAATRDDVARLLAGGGSVLAALEALLRLRQAACHAALVPGQRAERSSKLDRLVAVVEEAAADGHKSLVFSQWTSALDLIGPALEETGIGFIRLDGSTRDRRAVVEAFQDPAGPPVMLISLKAGGTGLNLTAADHVFLFDPWWNPATEDQAADRAHRIGQDRPVNVYRLVADDTVEERILALQQRKRALADAALDGGAAAGGLTRDDLMALLA